MTASVDPSSQGLERVGLLRVIEPAAASGAEIPIDATEHVPLGLGAVAAACPRRDGRHDLLVLGPEGVTFGATDPAPVAALVAPGEPLTIHGPSGPADRRAFVYLAVAMPGASGACCTTCRDEIGAGAGGLLCPGCAAVACSACASAGLCLGCGCCLAEGGAP